MEVVASLSQGRTAVAQCGLFTYESVPVIFEPPCTFLGCNELHVKGKTTPVQATLASRFCRQLAHWHMKVSRLTALPTGRIYRHRYQFRE